MEKHAACAAAISSSGFVPGFSSNRVPKEYAALESVLLSVEMLPLPSFNPPCHTADPLRSMLGAFAMDIPEGKIPKEDLKGDLDHISFGQIGVDSVCKGGIHMIAEQVFKVRLNLDEMDLAVRNDRVFDEFDSLKAGEAMEIRVDHDPRYLHKQLNALRPGQFDWQILEAAEDAWRFRLSKTGTAREEGCCGICGGD